MMHTAFSYTNRVGDAYYVHETRTKRGACRYVMKRSAKGALPALPAGQEIVENVNGQVSIRTPRARDILPLEEQLVKQSLESHSRKDYRVEVKGRDIVIHEPLSNVEELAEILGPRRALRGLRLDLDKAMRQKLGDAAWEEYLRQQKEHACEQLRRQMRYSPVMRFRLEDVKNRVFSVERMCYMGEGGWLRLAYDVTLAAACDRYVPLLGTEELFEEF